MAAKKVKIVIPAALITEAAKLARLEARLKPKLERLKVIKEQLREAAGTKDAEFKGEAGERAIVTHIADTIARSVDPEHFEQVKELAGDQLDELFRLAPAKGFELNTLKAIADRDQALALVELLKVPSSARVSFA
ncbi:MAG TPA: hypothetical protein VF614_13900 [Chthoniobacteraceae bacterium]|jgi:hypothetical protein